MCLGLGQAGPGDTSHVSRPVPVTLPPPPLLPHPQYTPLTSWRVPYDQLTVEEKLEPDLQVILYSMLVPHRKGWP